MKVGKMFVGNCGELAIYYDRFVYKYTYLYEINKKARLFFLRVRKSCCLSKNKWIFLKFACM